MSPRSGSLIIGRSRYAPARRLRTYQECAVWDRVQFVKFLLERDNLSVHEEFSEIARSELGVALSKMPSDPLHKFTRLLEMTRALDYAAFLHPTSEKDGGLSQPDYEMLVNGWKLAARYLLTPIRLAGLPVSE